MEQAYLRNLHHFVPLNSSISKESTPFCSFKQFHSQTSIEIILTLKYRQVLTYGLPYHSLKIVQFIQNIKTSEGLHYELEAPYLFVKRGAKKSPPLGKARGIPPPPAGYSGLMIGNSTGGSLHHKIYNVLGIRIKSFFITHFFQKSISNV